MARFHKYFIPVICVLTGMYAVVISQPQDYGVELLILDKDHWMDGLTVAKRQSKNISDIEFNSRDQRGDIIEIREWPFYTLPDHWPQTMEDAFRVVVIKGVTLKEAEASLWGGRDLTGRRAKRVSNNKTAEFETFNTIDDIDIRGPAR